MDGRIKKPSPSTKAGSKRSSTDVKSGKVKVKKEASGATAVKRKPVIDESDSENEYPPPPPKRAPNTESNSTHLTVKSEPLATPEKMEVLVSLPEVKKEIKHESPVKSKPSATKSTTKTSSTKKAGTKRLKQEDKEDDFKPSKSKKSNSKSSKPKKEPVVEEEDEADDDNDADYDDNGGINESDEEFSLRKRTPAKKKTASAKKPSSAKKTPATDKKPSKKAAAKKNGDATASPVKRGKKKEEEKEVWKWWEEEPHPEGVKWITLEHKGPYFAPPYEPLPPNINFYYNGKVMELSEDAEEAATFFAKMLDHDYTAKDVFCNNFFADWRKEMTSSEAAVIKDFEKCDFKEIHQYFKERSEARKQMTKEEKQKQKEENAAIQEEYGWCLIDGHKEKIGNFKTEPPGLFRGRGDHPKQGKIKRRIQPEDITINIGKEATVPKPPEGHKWKSVQHDNTVTWLASWVENIQGQIKYVMLNPTSRLKGEKDWAKYETARRLKEHAEDIRKGYTQDLHDKEMRIRQRAVALYFIDKLALRAGNEKDADEAADTVGCCSLRVEHIKLHEELDGKKDVVEFDFLGKDSIRYYNRVPVEHQVFKNLKLFKKNKKDGDDLFDRLSTTVLNKHLQELMPGLTAKVFRTYNASLTLQQQLNELTMGDDSVAEKFLSYNRANRAVAILCNHQRAAPKSFDQQMTNLQAKIEAKEEAIIDVKKEVKSLKKEAKGSKDPKVEKKLDTKKKQLVRLEEQLKKLQVQATDKEENKEIALGTSKLNYLDPRITVSWCKKWDVPIERVYNRSQREKFAWAIDMADETFEF